MELLAVILLFLFFVLPFIFSQMPSKEATNHYIYYKPKHCPPHTWRDFDEKGIIPPDDTERLKNSRLICTTCGKTPERVLTEP